MLLLLQKGGCIWSGTPPPPMGTHRPSDPPQGNKKNGKTRIKAKRRSLMLPSAFPWLRWTACCATELRLSAPWQLVLASLLAGPVLSHCKATRPSERGCPWLLVWVCCHSHPAFADSGFSSLWGPDVFKTVPGTWQDIGLIVQLHKADLTLLCASLPKEQMAPKVPHDFFFLFLMLRFIPLIL